MAVQDLDIEALAKELLSQFGGPNERGAWYRAAKYGLGDPALRAGLWQLINKHYVTRPVTRALLAWAEDGPPIVEVPPGALVLSDVDLSLAILSPPCPACGVVHARPCARGRQAQRLARSSEPEFLRAIWRVLERPPWRQEDGGMTEDWEYEEEAIQARTIR